MRWRSRSPTPYGPASSSTATCSRWRTSATGPTRPSRPTPPRSRSASHTTPRRGSASGRRGALLPPALARLPTRRRGGAAHRAGGAACRVRTPAHDRRAGRRRGRHRTRRARRPHAIDRARSRQPRQAALPTRGGASRRAAPRPPAGRRRPRERYLAGRPDARLHGYPCHRHGARARRLRRPGRRRARRPSGHPPLRVRPGRAGARLSQGRADLERGPGELPSQVDRRQPSLLAAVWTLVSAKHLAEAGAASVTYFETTGWRGVMETDEGTGLPDRFCSRPGTVFPVYHVLADLCELAGAEVLEAKSSEPLAAGLGSAGPSVLATDIDGHGLDELAATLEAAGIRAATTVVDLADDDAADRIVGAALEQFGAVHVLVNNAAVNRRMPILEMDGPTWDWITRVDLRLPYFLSQRAAREMIAQGSGGSIVSISSLNVAYALEQVSVYGPAKAGLSQLTRHMALEWA